MFRQPAVVEHKNIRALAASQGVQQRFFVIVFVKLLIRDSDAGIGASVKLGQFEDSAFIFNAPEAQFYLFA